MHFENFILGVISG